MTNFEKITHDADTLANFFVESIECSVCPCSNECYNLDCGCPFDEEDCSNPRCPYCGECQNFQDHCLTLFKHWLNSETEEK